MKVIAQSIRYETCTGDILYVVCQDDMIHFETWSNGYKQTAELPTTARVSNRLLEATINELQISGIDFVELENFIHYSGFIKDEY
ncbi:hypothetical protein vBAbaMPhT2_226 [Acinetobacter phage vB_AbaM_PhT2]|uniref:Uncharacterized protein n=1 Tax=Acinetobacter phage vB_AbaM_PhT2 TaxID=2690230 RepID=A0A6B9SY68_9CAUD|nr:hypothetical protein HYQ24_gp212 [Acinetobacter phage vB_AbaM_PhT2]QQM13849.1 hypothetical protein CPT_Maestro_115 [Acinetobacter phage Maestro]QQM18605.1 hypothetical protein CPT_Morttis_112 [Acinetobacter phage Morttis]QQO96312.1 hypothetical protein CPT_Minot_109 [Acinetobacter phage Minot]QQO96560.1 hypothetical protein CPT_Mokit_109 [Acinetobacter phage Mokit]QQO96815.1 hypothetical protein CPT_Melin_114 [Acinetobacter phage Melin]SSU39234.1 Uncharacterised protein [Acinetobacter baum